MSEAIKASPLPALGTRVAALPEVVYEHLRDAILRGFYQSGQSLPQEAIAQAIQVSRVPVREALRRLEAEGLVLQRPRRGYVVASLDPDEIEEIFDIRMMLEARAGNLATQNRTENDIADVYRLLHAMDGITINSAADAQLFAERNRAFHDRLFQASNRPHLCEMMLLLRNRVERYIFVGALIAGSPERTHREHHDIAGAFKRGDADEVARLSREHCLHTCQLLLKRLSKERELS